MFSAFDREHKVSVVIKIFDYVYDLIPGVRAFLKSMGAAAVRNQMDEFYGDLIEEFSERSPLQHYFAKRVEQAERNGTLDVYVFRDLLATYEERTVPLSEALEGIVPSSDILLIKVGESAKDPRIGLSKAIQIEMGRRERNAIAFKNIGKPFATFLVLFVMFTGIYGMVVVPKFVETIPLDKFGPFLRSFYQLGQIVKSIWCIPLVLGVAGFIYSIYWTLDNVTGEFRKKLDQLPPWTIYRVLQASSFSVMFSQLLQVNIPAVSALEKLIELATPFQRWHFSQMHERFDQGFTGTTAVNTGLFTTEMLDRIEVYEEKGKFDYIMREMGAKFATRINSMVDRSTARIGFFFFALSGFMTVMVIQEYYKLQSLITTYVGK